MAKLVESGVLHAEWVGEVTDAREAYWAPILTGAVHPRETQVTAFLTMLGNETEARVVRYFCEVAGVAYRKSFRLISGAQFSSNYHRSPKGSLQRIDLVVVDAQIWGSELHRNEAPGGGAVIAIECKFGASVNSNECPHHKARPDQAVDYGNQIICYPSGCTNPALSSRTVAFVWLAPTPKRGVSWPPSTALTRRWIELRRSRGDSESVVVAYEVALAEQEKHAGSWAPAWWPDLYERVAAGFGEDDAAERAAVLRALGARGAFE